MWIMCAFISWIEVNIWTQLLCSLFFLCCISLHTITSVLLFICKGVPNIIFWPQSIVDLLQHILLFQWSFKNIYTRKPHSDFWEMQIRIIWHVLKQAFLELHFLFLHLLYRMDDKGEVKCIKFSLGNKILAVQRTPKTVVSIKIQTELLHQKPAVNIDDVFLSPPPYLMTFALFFRISLTSFLIFPIWNSPMNARYVQRKCYSRLSGVATNKLLVGLLIYRFCQ